MNNWPQLRQIISVLMIFMLLLQFTGCYSTRIISTSEFESSDTYIMHGQKSIYNVSDVVVSNGILSGKLDYSRKTYSKANETNIYLLSDSVLKINNDRISLPVDGITKIEQKVLDPRKTKNLTTILIVAVSVGLVVGAVVGAGAIIGNLINRIKVPSTMPTTINEHNSTGLCRNW
jgi:hypothetical protein